jgi:hypothetical protein
LAVTFFIAKNKSVESGAWRYYRHIIRVGVNKALNTKDAILVPPFFKIYTRRNYSTRTLQRRRRRSFLPCFFAHKLFAATIGLLPRNVTLRLAREREREREKII